MIFKNYFRCIGFLRKGLHYAYSRRTLDYPTYIHLYTVAEITIYSKVLSFMNEGFC